MRRNDDRRKRQLPDSEFIGKRNPPAELVKDAGDDEDPTMAVVASQTTIVTADIVDAVCIRIERHHFQLYKQMRWVFTFAIAYPERYSNVDLKMFVRHAGEACRSSKLYKIAAVANGGPLESRQRIAP